MIIQDKPWAKLRLSRKQYCAAKPWKKANMSREKFEEMVQILPDDFFAAVKMEGEAERLLKSVFGEAIFD